MKTRPIGTIVAHSDTLNLILHMDVQDPKKGFAMRLSEDLSDLSEEQIMEFRTFFQEGLDTLCKGGEKKFKELVAQKATQIEQAELELDPPNEDELEIPAFIRRINS